MASKTYQLELVASGHGLFEAPLWTPDGLLVADVTTGGVLRVGDDGSASTVVEHRRFIGGIALHESGGLVVSGRNVAVKSLVGKQNRMTHSIIESDPDYGIVGYNDLTVDGAGRLYVGSVAFDALDD